MNLRSITMAMAFCAPTLALAEMPVFTARCPLGADIEADSSGTVRVNGAVAQVTAFNEQAYEARSGDFAFTITHAGGGRDLQVSYTGPNRANGVCTVREASAGGAATAGAAGATSMERVQFARGAVSARMSATNLPGQSIHYVLGARNGQTLFVEFATDSTDLTYRITNPDGSSLLDEIGTRQPYQGQLWQSGEHVVEVINRSALRNAAFDVRFTIQ